MRKLATVAAVTLAIAIGFSHRTEAQPAPVPGGAVLPPSSLGAGPWIVGGLGVSSLSVITYAAVIGNRKHRELTSAEATGAIALPFFWVF